MRFGLAGSAQASGCRGCTWACFIALAYGSLPGARPVAFTPLLPPWQSGQPRFTCPDLCIGSMPLWQLRQPSLLAIASASVWRSSALSWAKALAVSAREIRKVAATARRIVVSSLRSENQRHFGAGLEQRVGLVDILESVEGLEHGDEGFDDHVVVQEGPVLGAKADVDADVGSDRRLLEQNLH